MERRIKTVKTKFKKSLKNKNRNSIKTLIGMMLIKNLSKQFKNIIKMN